MKWFPFSKIVRADVVLIPVCDGDDVVFLRNEPVFLTPRAADIPNSGQWYIMSGENSRIIVFPARKSVFFGYYCLWND